MEWVSGRSIICRGRGFCKQEGGPGGRAIRLSSGGWAAPTVYEGGFPRPWGRPWVRLTRPTGSLGGDGTADALIGSTGPHGALSVLLDAGV